MESVKLYGAVLYKRESSKGSSEKKMSTIDELKSLNLKISMGMTDALCLQIEVQRKLHEQLQTSLQLCIEEKGRYLQMMFEKQRKLESKGYKATSSAVSDDATPSAAQSASGNKRTEPPDQNSPRTEVDPSNPSRDGSSPSLSGKHKIQDKSTAKEVDLSSTKTARRDKSN